ncbi:MFS transporter [Streptomyces sp. NPDC017988]|uniref:MFS transporter n=1 Tax=Streptomyces sp. NPDC017988 TaxID=3365025 RepID=UPI003797941C
MDIAAARRSYVMICALFWLPLGLAIAPQLLLFAERGMTLAAIAGFFAAHSLTAALLELPTGGLSDVLGRRAVLVAAGLTDLAAFALLGLGTDAWVFVLGMALKGAGRALSSGPAEAWYVDTVHAAAGPDAELRSGLARGGSATSAALAVGTLVGGALPWLLGLGPDLGAWLSRATSGVVLPLSVPVLLAAAVDIVFVLYVLTALTELPRTPVGPRAVLRGVPATIVSGVRLVGGDALVRRVLLGVAATGAAFAAVELLTPGRVADLAGDPEAGAVLFAGLACAGYVCSALGSHLAPLTARLTGGSGRAVLAGLGAGAGGLLLLAATASAAGPVPVALGAAGFALVHLGLGVAGPNENDLLHRRVTSAGRATALSVQSLALQLACALAAPAVGALPAGPLPWLVGGVALTAGTLLWIRPVPAPRAASEAALPEPVRPGAA